MDVVNTLIVLKDRVHSSKLAEERHGALLGLSSIINSLLNRTIQQSDISDEIITVCQSEEILTVSTMFAIFYYF